MIIANTNLLIIKIALTYLVLADDNGASMKVAKYLGTDKVDLIENAEFGYCSLIKATENILNKLDIENITKTEITNNMKRKASCGSYSIKGSCNKCNNPQ